MAAFVPAHGPDWRRCVAALGRPGRGLGFVYLTDVLAGEADKILDVLKTQTGIRDWIGSVGTGVLATGTEYQDEPAMAAMVADIDDFSVFSGRRAANRFRQLCGRPRRPRRRPTCRASCPTCPGKSPPAMVVGGVSSSRSRTVQIANEVAERRPFGRGSGGQRVAVATRLTQGCTPYPDASA